MLLNTGLNYSSNNNNFNSTISAYKKELWQYDFSKNKTNITWIPTYNDTLSNNKGELIFSAVRSIINPLTSESVGFFLVNAKEDNIFSTYEGALNGTNSIYVINENGRIVSHQNKDLIGIYFYQMDRLDKLFENNNYVLTKKSGDNYLFSKYKKQTNSAE